MNSDSPSLSAFSRNIELRVDAGVQSALQSIENVEDKGRILQHLCNLVRHVSTRSPYNLRGLVFERPLEAILVSEEGSSLSSDLLSDPERDFSFETKTRNPSILSKPDKPAISLVNHNFVTLLRSECGLDLSKTFVQILIQVKVLSRPKHSERATSEDTCVRLNVGFEKSMPATWELTAIEGSREGDALWFGGRLALMTLAMAASLQDLRLSVTAKAADGCSQSLGLYTMSSILSCNIDPSLVTMSSVKHVPYMRSASFVLEGTGAQNLCQLKEKSELDALRILSINTREKLATMSVTVESKTDLALSVAGLKHYTDDSVDIRSSVNMTPSALGLLDDTLLTLEAETNTIRELSARSDSFGYTLPDITQIIEMQMLTDENLGAIEEGFLSSLG